MFDIEFYQQNNGKEPVKEFLLELRKNSDRSKEDKIRFEKMLTYLRVLEEKGTTAGYPYVKHIVGTKLFEVRPLRDRVFFFLPIGNKIILLHHFYKKTQKTPKREIDQAVKYMEDYLERSEENGK